MNGSTRLCVSILNAFSLVLFLVGLTGISLVLEATNRPIELMIGEVSVFVGAVVFAALLRSASEGLRLLSEIRQSLRQPRTIDSNTSVRAA